MNFFEHQDQARRNTALLIFLFGVAIASMIVAFYIVTVMGLMVYDVRFAVGVSGFFHPGLFLMVAAGTLGVVGVGSLSKMVQLQGGGKVIAQSLGGKKVSIQTQNENLRRLLNVVEEMAIASGVPVPSVYVMTGEDGINAFAAGFSVNDAVIGVTHGCVQNLTRDELQGVIAHEFSHILNGDMRLNLNMIGVLQGILIMYIGGRMLLRGSLELRGRSAAAVVAAGAAFTTIGGVGFLCGRLIKSAVSRQREFLADASAVQFTRNPHGIASALQKIGGYSTGSSIVSPTAEEASHMFFGTIGRSSFVDLFATHPPLNERIRRLSSLPKTAVISPKVSPAASSSKSTVGVMGFQSGGRSSPISGQTSQPSQRSRAASGQIRVNADQVVTGIGTADPKHLAYAQNLLGKLPQGLKTALRTSWGAEAVIYGLLMDAKHSDVRDRQLTQLQQTETQDVVNLSLRICKELSTLDPRIRLPLVDLTIPALRDQTPKDIARFFKQIQFLVRADGRLSLSEYTLQIILQRRLQPYLYPNKPTQSVHHHINAVWDDCLAVLSGLARVGHSKPEAIAYAFRSGTFRLPGAGHRNIPDIPPHCTLPQIGQSLSRLVQSSPKIKQAIVDACAHTVLIDQEVTVKEAELLRAVVIALDCPIPPFLDASIQTRR